MSVYLVVLNGTPNRLFLHEEDATEWQIELIHGDRNNIVHMRKMEVE